MRTARRSLPMLRAAVTICAWSLAGCAGLPSKQAPPALPKAIPLADLGTGGGAAWPDAEWWRRYQDTTLDQLIDSALASSPTLKTAHARFDSARESVRSAGAAAGARIGLDGDFNRQRLSDNGLFPPQLLGFHWYNLADLGLKADYTFDWWGKQRSLIAAAVDEAHATQAERSAAAIVLASSIADTYFGWQADENRLALARERLAAVERARLIAAERLQAELEAADAVHRADTAIAAAREQQALLEGSARLRVVALAALVGRPAGELPPLAAKPLPAVGASLPDDVRLDLISRRADITAGRWRVEAAERNLESARADFYPDISINALAGVSAIDAGKLLEYGSRAPQAGLALHLPIFDAGRLRARYRAGQVLIRSAVAGYEQTLIDAARDVATQVTTRQQVEAQRAQRLVEVDAAAQLRASAAARVRQGIDDSRTELTAVESWIEQRDALLQLDAAALSADIGLQRALGGGYESPQSLAVSERAPGKATP